MAWEVKAALFDPPTSGDPQASNSHGEPSEALTALLDGGWIPFGVTPGVGGTGLVWVRRQADADA